MSDSPVVMVVDDDESVRDAFKLALSDNAVDVQAFDGGEPALEFCSKQAPDMAFVDLRMPGMNGVEVLRAIQTKRPEVPLVVITAFAQEYMLELREARSDGLSFQLFAKPLVPDKIRELVSWRLAR